ncbi:hypothetical protein [Pseudoalteromonas luteoviolacea]|uniref:Uncharacterized protein n=1 Tax=Pseudoalteromonas luteoviolacea S4060-1 TaxID=1365257 RepID=A0A167NAC4_9GAMM|nr:hypothetical protein [Pseudoalteromonas luteoviolacea]KZN67822.1 hypothetical protein N478_16500 [Pseudoalteromonas luteoviolacea S4060-1]
MKNWFKHFFSKHDEHCAEHQTDVFNFTTALLGQSKTAMLQALIHDAMGNPFITVRYHLGRRRTDPLTAEFNSVALVNIDKLLISNRWEVRAENQWHEGVYTLVFSKEKLLDVLHTRSIFYTNQEQSEVQSYLSLSSLTSLNKPIYRHIIPLMLKSYARQFSKKQSSEQTFLEVKLLKILMESYLETMTSSQYKQWDEQARESTKACFIERIAANHVGRYTDKQVVQAYEILRSF